TVPGSFGCGSAVLANSTMLAPSSAKRLAIAKPIPRLPPEIRTVFSCRVVLDTLTPFSRERGLGYILPDFLDTVRTEYFLVRCGATRCAPGLSCPWGVPGLWVWRFQLQLCCAF